MNVLKTRDVSMRFGGLTAVNNLSLEVGNKDLVALIGPNGAGKTTVFNMITGVYAPTEGDIFFKGEKLNGLRPDQIAKRGIARTFQNIRLYRNLSVLENVLIANHLHIESSLLGCVLHFPGARREEKEMEERSMELLRLTSLDGFRDEVAGSLPYGHQRKLEIARALATSPDLLLLDEPAAGMNPRESGELALFIQGIREQFHIAILLIEHHMKLVMKIAERIYVLEYGKMIAHGTPSEISANELVVRAYLGEEEV